MTITALLTGKGTNSLRDKNLLPVRGKPLLYYPAMAALRCGRIGRFFVSSDGPSILDTAAALGFERIERPPELCRPDSRHVDAINHALDIMHAQHRHDPDILVVLLANNISVTAAMLADSIDQILADPTISAVVPVYEDQDHHPFRAKSVATDGTIQPFLPLAGDVSTNRQDLPPCYYLCHNFWTLNLSRSVRNGTGQPPWSFMGPRVKPIKVEESVDVHIARDLLLCEDWLDRHDIRYD
ncbi:MAG: NTP transferase domain-containing protein [Opitutae bacterium]|nr:NTP transferase domain-containing protein [Opitutae bacterium]